MKMVVISLSALDARVHVLDMLRAIKTVIDHDADKIPDTRGYYILQLDYKDRMLKRWFFKRKPIDAIL